MVNPAGESNGEVLWLDFDRRLTLQLCGSVVTSDAALLTYPVNVRSISSPRSVQALRDKA